MDGCDRGEGEHAWAAERPPPGERIARATTAGRHGMVRCALGVGPASGLAHWGSLAGLCQARVRPAQRIGIAEMAALGRAYTYSLCGQQYLPHQLSSYSTEGES